MPVAPSSQANSVWFLNCEKPADSVVERRREIFYSQATLRQQESLQGIESRR
jgi:hypothetical protein